MSAMNYESSRLSMVTILSLKRTQYLLKYMLFIRVFRYPISMNDTANVLQVIQCIKVTLRALKPHTFRTDSQSCQIIRRTPICSSKRVK